VGGERGWIAERKVPARAIDQRARIAEDVVFLPPGRAMHTDRLSTNRRLQEAVRRIHRVADEHRLLVRREFRGSGAGDEHARIAEVVLAIRAILIAAVDPAGA